MDLFDNLVRTSKTSKGHMQGSFDYLNKSARPACQKFRELANEWFSRIPEGSQKDLWSRFRSPIESQHQGAFFELYIHELFIRQGFTLSSHPVIPDSSSRPDFLVTAGDGKSFYLEATLAGLPSHVDVGAAARVNSIYDVLDRVESPNFFLSIAVSSFGSSAPPARNLSKALEAWLSTLNPDEVAEYHWAHEGWNIEFSAIQKSSEARGKEGIRPLGMFSSAAQWLSTDEDIRQAIGGKALKYGSEVPLLIATNVVAMHCDQVDIMNALFGNEAVQLDLGKDGRVMSQHQSRQPNGIWRGTEGIRNQHIAAVLTTANLCPWNMAVERPVLVHNPWARSAVTQLTWQIDQLVPNLNRMNQVLGANPGQTLGLPSPWPIPDDD